MESSTPRDPEPFDYWFRNILYLETKSDFFSYLRRKEEIERLLPESIGVALEIGAGTSPILEPTSEVIYSDVSHPAMQYVKTRYCRSTIVFDGGQIPLANGSITTVVCSEVIEHIDDDVTALKEFHRILRPGGHLILTAPLHSYYFGFDDRFVGHRRRYAIRDLLQRLAKAGFGDFEKVKVAGPLEKFGTLLSVFLFAIVTQFNGQSSSSTKLCLQRILPLYKKINRMYARLVRWESKLIPWSLSTIILVDCRKKFSKEDPLI